MWTLSHTQAQRERERAPLTTVCVLCRPQSLDDHLLPSLFEPIVDRYSSLSRGDFGDSLSYPFRGETNQKRRRSTDYTCTLDPPSLHFPLQLRKPSYRSTHTHTHIKYKLDLFYLPHKREKIKLKQVWGGGRLTTSPSP